ncbi:unnamed protein product [Symbiodinium natans]|uniref:Uncharacterized protein n=1 Tax=Symbiodinium natans TaxID=878477 RepID=A0A812ILM9_9DINO|nr:unnamed protein product [Symbiodinium natans]
MADASSSHTIKDVERSEVEEFVQEHLCGTLDAPKTGNKNLLVFHMPKFHSHVKCASGKFDQTHSGGSLKYYIKTKTLVLQQGYHNMEHALLMDRLHPHRDTSASSDELVFNLRQLWEAYSNQEQPMWRDVRERPRSYDGSYLASGKHRGETFKSVYGGGNNKYVKWLTSGEAEGDPSRGKTSLGMRMFYEYCLARQSQPDNDATAKRCKKRPAAAME